MLTYCYKLDIHSLSRWTDTFLFKSDEEDPVVSEFAQVTLLPTVLIGSRNLYVDTGEWATEDYAYDQWKKWLCIECGQHKDANSYMVAYNASINCMRWLWVLTWILQKKSQQKIIQFTQMIYKEKPGTFSKAWVHWDKLMKWVCIAEFDDWEKILCEDNNMIMLLPKRWAQLWWERFFLWKEII